MIHLLLQQKLWVLLSKSHPMSEWVSE